MPVNLDYKIFFIHIPKCGGSSIEKLFNMDGQACMIFKESPIVLQHFTPQQVIGYLGPIHEYLKFYKFTVIRNPYERVVSDFFWFSKHNSDVLNKYKILSINDFIKLRCDVVKNNRYGENIYFDHFRPQLQYLEKVNDFEYDKIIRLENLNEDLLDLCKKIGFDVLNNEIPRINTTDHTHYSVYLDEEAIDLIRQLERPIELGYTF